MIFFDVKLPGIRKDYPATVYETRDACLNKFVAQIFRAQHVVPTVYSWPHVSLRFPHRKRDWIHWNTPYRWSQITQASAYLSAMIWGNAEILKAGIARITNNYVPKIDGSTNMLSMSRTGVFNAHFPGLVYDPGPCSGSTSANTDSRILK